MYCYTCCTVAQKSSLITYNIMCHITISYSCFQPASLASKTVPTIFPSTNPDIEQGRPQRELELRHGIIWSDLSWDGINFIVQGLWKHQRGRIEK